MNQVNNDKPREQELNEAAKSYAIQTSQQEQVIIDPEFNHTADIKAFKAGANWQSQRDADRAKILVEAIQSYLEVQKFLAKPDDDNCVSSSDFRIALRKYNGEN